MSSVFSAASVLRPKSSRMTTIAGLLPQLAESGLQAQILKPMVVSLAFGLLASVYRDVIVKHLNK